MPKSPPLSELYHQVNWILTALDLYLDMERNLSDSRYADDDENEIIYTFDEDIFELFIGGTDQDDPSDSQDKIFTDRRRAIGVFHVRAWRSLREIKEGITPAEDRRRAEINRQSAILATEWLFCGNLPGRRGDAHIYISRQHLREFTSRWERLVKHYRSKLHAAIARELSLIEWLERDPATVARGGSVDIGFIDKYIADAKEPLKNDLIELWSVIRKSDVPDAKKAKSFARFAFSRKLVETLAKLEITQPLRQLNRLNQAIAGRLRYIDQAMTPDEPEKTPPSEMFEFWEKRLAKEIQARKSRNPEFRRNPRATSADARTIARVQTLANTSVRGDRKKRFVFVTADPVLIDVYRAWHCEEAEPNEPFVLRPVRHFAPLLNIRSMSAANGEASDLHAKEEIFPLLRQAIVPFLFRLNLRDMGVQTGHHEDSVRWYREQYALKLRRALNDYRYTSDENRDETLRKQVAHQIIFPVALSDLKEASNRLAGVMREGRRVERLAIGYSFDWQERRLAELKELKDALVRLREGDEGPLAKLMHMSAAELRATILGLFVQFFDISADLQQAVSRLGPVTRKVPLVLNLTFGEEGSRKSIAEEANRMVEKALAARRAGLAQVAGALDPDLSDSSIQKAGGYLLFALYGCIALRLNEWSVAHHCADEAYSRALTSPDVDENEKVELEYLYALCARFRVGSGPLKDASVNDVTNARYDKACDLLEKRIDSLRSFAGFRAATELSSLKFFACAWSMFEEDLGQRRFPEDMIDKEFGKCVGLLNKLIHEGSQIRNGSGGITRGELEQLEEQIAVNITACYCLAKLGALPKYRHMFPKDDVSISPAALEWVTAFVRSRRGEKQALSHIAQFYFTWFDFVTRGGRLPNDVKEHVTLSIDSKIARRFENELLPHQQGQG